MRAPIADVVGQSAEAAALDRLAGEMHRARQEGRMLIELPLGAIDAHYLTRDRIALDAGEMEVLQRSLLARGQQTPIEVIALPNVQGEPLRYGLISGYRRLTALRALKASGAWDGTVNALVRQPGDAGQAYTAMVEENEVRVGLSYFERARIVTQAVAQGVFVDDIEGLRVLFQSVSRSKRSKIKSFIPLVKALGPHLSYPLAIGERLGLALSARITSDPDFGPEVAAALDHIRPDSQEAEQKLLHAALAPPPSAKAAPYRTKVADMDVAFRDRGAESHRRRGHAGCVGQNPDIAAGGLRLKAAALQSPRAYL